MSLQSVRVKYFLLPRTPAQGRVFLTFVKPEIPSQPCQWAWTDSSVRTLITVDVITIFLFWVSQVSALFFCLAEFLFLFTLFLYLSHCLKSVGRWEAALRRGTLQEACLSVGSTRGHSRWFEGRSGRLETSSSAAVNKWCCQSLLFEVLTALSANNPVALGWSLSDGKSLRKRNVKTRCFIFYFFYFVSHSDLERLRWTFICVCVFAAENHRNKLEHFLPSVQYQLLIIKPLKWVGPPILNLMDEFKPCCSISSLLQTVRSAQRKLN